jgi:acetyl-CoA/propionyl-CoA carboxylase biotin carboxyl carrier protein
VGRGFLPTPGLITRFAPPSGPGVRLDSGVETGSVIPGSFDSMMAKLIVTGPRVSRPWPARRALAEFRIEGVASVLPFHKAVLNQADFVGTTASMSTPAGSRPSLPSRWPRRPRRTCGRHQPAAHRHRDRRPPRAAGPARHAAARSVCADDWRVSGRAQQSVDPDAVISPIAGNLHAWKVADGDEVKEGDVIAVMEAMKMEMQVSAHRAVVSHWPHRQALRRPWAP